MQDQKRKHYAGSHINCFLQVKKDTWITMTLVIMTLKHQDIQHLCQELLVQMPHVMEKCGIYHVKNFCSSTLTQNHKAATHNTFPLICHGEQNLKTIVQGSQGQKFWSANLTNSLPSP